MFPTPTLVAAEMTPIVDGASVDHDGLTTLLTSARASDGDDAEILGGKGAALGRLIASGYPVPSTGVVTTSAYRRVATPNVGESIRSVVESNEFTADQIDALFERAPVDPRVEQEIVSLARRVGDGNRLAIRSSATVEDLHGSSFAGQYQSFLNVDSSNTQAVMSAVRHVWASLWHPAPTAYRRAFAMPDEDAAMAVVMMQMIPATTAGVVFTTEPGGSDDMCRIEAVEGLGESLVSGARTPSAWLVPRVANADVDLPIAIRRAMNLSLDIESRFGVPQDVEWAAQHDDVFIVQARPITVLDLDDGFDSRIDDHELTTAGIVEMVPGVLAPLIWELNYYVLGEAFRSFLDNLGIIRGSAAEDDPFVRRVRGRAAIDFDQLREAASGVDGAVDELETQYFGVSDSGAPDSGTSEDDAPDSGRSHHQSIRQRFAGLGQDARAQTTRRTVIEQADVVVRATDVLLTKRPSLAQLTESEVLSYIGRVIDLGARGLAAELGVAATAAASYRRLERLIEPHLGPDEAKREAQLVTAGTIGAVVRPLSGSAAIFGGPSWEELELTSRIATGSARADQDVQRKELEGRLRLLPGWTRKRVLTGQIVDVRLRIIRRAVNDAVEQMQRREATKAAVLSLGGEVRRAHLELGRRMVAHGLLSNPADIELMSTSEIATAVQRRSAPRADTFRRRRNWLSRYEAEGPLPIRFTGPPSREPTPLPEGDVLQGWASSPGRYRGRARVLTNPAQHLEHGDVLVAATTDASWSPIFVHAGAVVVEQGGPLSHAAILARELGVPAVLNIDGATRVLDGCAVTVDGDAGVVVIEERRDPGVGGHG
jgi:phosphohistidine swiveling domain-containing protein